MGKKILREFPSRNFTAESVMEKMLRQKFYWRNFTAEFVVEQKTVEEFLLENVQQNLERKYLCCRILSGKKNYVILSENLPQNL